MPNESVVHDYLSGKVATRRARTARKSQGSSVILVGSIASIKGFEYFSVYDATKAAVRSSARVGIMDLKNRGIRVNVLSPGHIDTHGLSALMTDERKAAVVAKVPLSRLGTPGRDG